MSFKKGLSAEFEFMAILEDEGFITWHLQNHGDLLATKVSSDNIYAIEVKVVYYDKNNQGRLYLRKDSYNGFLATSDCFGFKPVFAIKDKKRWILCRVIDPITRNTTITMNQLTPFRIEELT